MIVKETNKFLREIKCPFCDCEQVESDKIEPLGNTDFTKEQCEKCGEIFYWKRQTTTEYLMAIEE